MNLNFDLDITGFYSSNSQIARVLTENWVKNNGYCPSCGEILYKLFLSIEFEPTYATKMSPLNTI